MLEFFRTEVAARNRRSQENKGTGPVFRKQFFTRLRLGRLVCFVPPFMSFLGLCVLMPFVRRARDAPDKVRRPDMFRPISMTQYCPQESVEPEAAAQLCPTLPN